jgi:AcrR family transcriptional regulator
MPRARKLPAPHRRRLIIESAREVFAAQSYSKVGTADIAKAAGISEPALYRYFATKKELFLATLRATGPKVLEIWQDIASDVDDPLETLWAVGVRYYDYLQSHSGGMKVQFQALSEADDPEIREALRENFGAFVRFISDTLEEGMRRGIVRSDVDARLLAWQFLGLGLTLDLMHTVGLDSEIDRTKAERWGRLYQEMVRAERPKSVVGPAVRAVSELMPAPLEV